MAITVTPVRQEQLGNSVATWGTVTFDSSYPTGGEAFAVAAVSGEINVVEKLDVVLAGGSGYTTGWDSANQKLLVYYADYDAVADGALIQIPNTTDLSTVTLSFFAVGQ